MPYILIILVFLRVLEYYSGILFLTTNRLGDFDEAFTSRVHISLHYPQLDLNQTLQIFKLNERLIKRRFKENGRRLIIESNAIQDFAAQYWAENEKMRWNGRQIRNACQTALAMAEFEAQGGSVDRIVDRDAQVVLTINHLTKVSEAYQGFMQYLKDIYGHDSDRRAKYLNIRARENLAQGNPAKGDTNINSQLQSTAPANSKMPLQPASQYVPMPNMVPDTYAQQVAFQQAVPQQMNPMMTGNAGQMQLPNQQQQPAYIAGQGFPQHTVPMMTSNVGHPLPPPQQQQPNFLANRGSPQQLNPTAWSSPLPQGAFYQQDGMPTPQLGTMAQRQQENTSTAPQGSQQQGTTGQSQPNGTSNPQQGFQQQGMMPQGQQSSMPTARQGFQQQGMAAQGQQNGMSTPQVGY